MTKCVLSFSLEHTASYKIAEFESVEEKNAYVAAEFSDKTIKKYYFAYQCAFTKKARKKAAANLDAARFSFYKRWRNAKKGFRNDGTPPTAA